MAQAPEVLRPEVEHHPRFESMQADYESEAAVLAGFLAEFDDVDAIIDAAEKVRDAGFRRWDVHSPFPIHGIDEAMNIRPSILPWLVLGGGLFGMVGGLVMQWWMMA